MDITIGMDLREIELTLDELGGQVPRVGDLIDITHEDGTRKVAQVEEVIWVIPKEGIAKIWITTGAQQDYEDWLNLVK